MTHSNANEGRKVGHSALRWNKETQAMEMFDPHPVPASASHGDAPGFDEATESRWQKAIYKQCKRILPNVDGSGCESGDALDVTISEITQCFAHFQNERDSLRSERGGQDDDRDKKWFAAADKLLTYIEDHGWGIIPEPWDSITPLYDLMYERCPTCHNLDRRGDRSKRDHVRIPGFVCTDAWHDIVPTPPASGKGEE